MPTQKIAVVGCGRIALELERDPLRYKPCTHLGALRYFLARDKSLRPVAFCDTSLDRAQAAADYSSSKNALVTEDFAAVLSQKPDLLIIAASTRAHFPLLKAALAKNVPRIVIEKPVAFSAGEALQLKKITRRTQTVILPNYERRYHPKYLKLKERVADAHSYRGLFVAGGRSLYADKKTGNEGVLLHDTTHLLDLAQFLFGKILRYETITRATRHLLFLEHASGVCGTLETILGAGVFHLELDIHLPKERVCVGNGFLSHEKIAASRHYRALKSYNAPVRFADRKFSVQKNPFVALYQKALYERCDNYHFAEALENVIILSGRR